MISPTTERRIRRRGRVRIAADLLYRLLRFIARHVRGFFGPMAAFLTLGFAVAVGAVLLFAILGRIVAAGVTQTFDETVLRWLARHRAGVLDIAALEVTSLGNTFVTFVLLAICGLFLWLTRHRYSVYLLAVSVVGGALLNTLLKSLYDRPRPSAVAHVADVHTTSFPSGHAMSAMVAYGSVAFLVSRLEPTPRLRRFTWAIAALVIFAIGLSRMYLGVHYPSDIIAGWVAGLAWVLFVASGMTALRFFARRHPEVYAEEKDLAAETERAAGMRA